MYNIWYYAKAEYSQKLDFESLKIVIGVGNEQGFMNFDRFQEALCRQIFNKNSEIAVTASQALGYANLSSPSGLNFSKISESIVSGSEQSNVKGMHSL